MESGFAEGYAVGKDSGNGNGGMFGGYAGEWIWIIVLFALWQNGGFGGNQGGYGMHNYYGGGGYVTNDELQMGFFRNDVSDKLDGINYGLADGFYAVNTGLLNGFASVQNALCQGFAGINQNINNVGYAIKDCCCTTQRAIDGVNYNVATQFGALNTTLCGLGRDIIENANANARAIHEELVANKIEAKNERIAELTAQLQRADLKASQQAQNAYLLSELKPCPTPAYVVQPPQQVTFPTDCCGTVSYASRGNGCGCC